MALDYLIPHQLKFTKSWGNRKQTLGIIIHHPALYSADVQRIHNAEMSRLGGFPYNIYVRKDGTIHEGRGLDAVAAHCTGQNTTTIGVSFEGYFHPKANGAYDTKMNPQQFNAGVKLLKDLIKMYPTIGFIKGHSSFKSTACPGDYFPLLEMVQAVYTADPPEKPAEVAPKSLYSATVTSQTLLMRDAPNTAGKVLDTLKNGQTLDLLEELKPWAKVKRSDGVIGYCAIDHLRIEKVTVPAYTKDKPLVIQAAADTQQPHFKYLKYPADHLINFGVSGGKGVTPHSQWAGETSDGFMRRVKPQFLSNGGFFGGSCSPVFCDGQRMLVTPGEEKWTRGLEIDRDQKTFRFTDIKPGKTWEGIAARPALIWDGKEVPPQQRYVDGNFEYVRVVRKALGFDGQNFITLVVENPGATLDEMIAWGQRHKLQYLIGIDGGGSAREQALLNGAPKHLTKCTDPNRMIANFVHWDLDCPYVVIYTIRKGDKGDTVRHLQRLLLTQGYDLGTSGVDGDFGSKTDAAVRVFQRAKGLIVDAIAGQKTWEALGV